MTLKKGRSKKTIDKNISTLKREGVPNQTAIAMAFSKAKAFKRGK